MTRLIYVIETWRAEAGEEIELNENGFPVEHWHEHAVDVSLQNALEELMGYENTFNSRNNDWTWNEFRETIVPFPGAYGAGRLGFKITLKDTDGTSAIHLVIPAEIEDDKD